MSTLPITCDNCGAKYKLPESFAGSHAKCQKCGSVIDVQKQRGGTGAPAAAKPAAARPAAARPATEKPAAARSTAPARAGRASKGGDEAPARGRRERGERGEPKKGNMTPVLLGVAALAAIGAGAFFLLRDGGQPPADTNQQASANASAKPAEKPAEKPAAKPAEKPAEYHAAAPAVPPADAQAAKPADPAGTPPAKPSDAGAAKPADANASAPDVADDPSQPKRPWQKMRNPPASLDQVTDPKSYGEVPWPASVDDAKKQEIRGLAEDVAGGGRAGIRARGKLLELDYPAMFGIVEKLRTIDYRSAEESMVAFELNKLLEEITFELNARFEPVEISETIPPAKAEWNTRTVKAWIDLMGSFQDEAKFKEGRAARKKKAAGEMK
jgi:hypothetical protein